MSDGGSGDFIEIEYVRVNYTRDTIRSVNEQCQLWNAAGFDDEELIAVRDEGKAFKLNVQPKGVL